MSLVSIIIPVYNVEKYLNKCIDSVLNQTYKDLEVILVDDGSTDSSPEICDDYGQKDSRVKVIHKENGGQGEARNFGLDIAKGEYVLFVDSDDYIAKNTVELTLQRAEKYNADMVIFDYVMVDERGNIIYRDSINFPKETKIIPKTDKYAITANPSPVMQLYRKSIFDDKELRFVSKVIYEDLRLMPKLFASCSVIVYADCEPLYYYLKRDNSTIRNGNIEKTKSHRIAAMEDVVAYFKQKGMYELYREELDWIWIYHGFYLPATEILKFKGKYCAAINELRRAMKGNIVSFKNKYINTFSSRAKFVLYTLYCRFYFIWRILFKYIQ